MDAFPNIDRTPDGWYRQRWRARVVGPLPPDLPGLGQHLEAVAYSKLLETWSGRGEDRRDPIRVTCIESGDVELDVTIEVQSEHPDWKLGAVLGAIQGLDEQLRLTHLQGRPRSQLRPWYLSGRSGDSG